MPRHDEDSAFELHLAITTSLVDAFKLNEAAASAMAAPIVENLRRRYACEEIYVPAPSKSNLREQVRAAFNGRNRQEVMRKFGISRSTFYNYIGTK